MFDKLLDKWINGVKQIIVDSEEAAFKNCSLQHMFAFNFLND